MYLNTCFKQIIRFKQIIWSIRPNNLFGTNYVFETNFQTHNLFQTNNWFRTNCRANVWGEGAGGLSHSFGAAFWGPVQHILILRYRCLLLCRWAPPERHCFHFCSMFGFWQLCTLCPYNFRCSRITDMDRRQIQMESLYLARVISGRISSMIFWERGETRITCMVLLVGNKQNTQIQYNICIWSILAFRCRTCIHTNMYMYTYMFSMCMVAIDKLRIYLLFLFFCCWHSLSDWSTLSSTSGPTLYMPRQPCQTQADPWGGGEN